MINKKFREQKETIISYFNNRKNIVFTKNMLHAILFDYRSKWNAGINLGINDFLKFLEEECGLQQVVLEFPKHNINRYVFKKDISPYKIACSIKSSGYFSHYSAMFLNGLTEQIPQSIFFNIEQSDKSSFSYNNLTQDQIDKAFSKEPKLTNQIAQYNEYKLHLLTGKFTGNLGVINLEEQEVDQIQVTGLERTLIDIAVRPNYSGGIYEVLKAYEKAHSYVSINKLSAILEKINFIYPYHQVIGFYLEKTGKYTENQLNIMKSFETKHNFYLTHNMINPKFSKTWKLFYPSNFQPFLSGN